MRKFYLLTALVCAVLSTPALVDAGYSFTNISESSSTDPSPPLTFGLPPTVTNLPGTSTVVADFDPVGFASSQTGLGSDITDGQLNFTIMATDDDKIIGVEFNESGSFTLTNAGSSVQYGLTVVPTVTMVDGSATSIALPPKTVSGTESTSGLGNWTLHLGYDIAAALTGLTGVVDPYSATKVEFAIDNTLVAVGTGATSVAFIDKKDFSVSVPEPSSFLFLGAILTGTVLWQKRRNLAIEEDS